jgi:FlaA1/EpsC-like NDP-sugar epimerase
MLQNIKLSIPQLEKMIISNNNRYKLNLAEKNEIKKTLFNQNILIIGACGSIGKQFTKQIYKFNFKKIYLLDKNENELVELNRELVLLNIKKVKKIHYVCTDITSFNLDEFLLNSKITHYYNFAAMKHVRSEEYLDSLKYMFKTNSEKFCPAKKNYLKLFFSISSDKAVLPQSLLGVSKYFMEEKISNFSKKNRSVFLSTVRFANVCFSEGSYLKYVKERIEKKISFGLPINIKRYFITHEEAISLCFKAILKKNKNKILMPSDKVLNKEYSLSSLVKKLLDIYGYKIKYSKKVLSVKRSSFPVVVIDNNLEGQKNYEEFYNRNIDQVTYDNDNQTMKIDLVSRMDTNLIVKKIQKQKTKKEIIKLIRRKIKTFIPKKNSIKVSHLV